MLSDAEIDRYARHLLLREMGGAGQQRLKAARVLVIGTGGLGCPASIYLAAAGVGHITLVDPDTVSVSNLQRQVLFGEADIGEPKVSVARGKLVTLNPHVTIEGLQLPFSTENAAELVAQHQLVIDGSDRFSTRFAANRACHEFGRTLVTGAISRWMGQVGVFASGPSKSQSVEERLPCYQCLVPETPDEADTCEREGVLGALAGVIGTMMAVEAVKALMTVGDQLVGRLLIYDAFRAEVHIAAVEADPDCPVCGQQGQSAY